MFADIVGFTAWSSVREPAQVFTLLENLYSAFDAIAEQRQVFKVETVSTEVLVPVQQSTQYMQPCLTLWPVALSQDWRLLCGGGWVAQTSSGPCGCYDTIRPRLYAYDASLE